LDSTKRERERKKMVVVHHFCRVKKAQKKRNRHSPIYYFKCVCTHTHASRDMYRIYIDDFHMLVLVAN
jgi:hypothetical protein